MLLKVQRFKSSQIRNYRVKGLCLVMMEPSGMTAMQKNKLKPLLSFCLSLKTAFLLMRTKCWPYLPKLQSMMLQEPKSLFSNQLKQIFNNLHHMLPILVKNKNHRSSLYTSSTRIFNFANH